MRTELRKVQISKAQSEFNGLKGYFHRWVTYGDYEEGIRNYGIIELENGRCVNIEVYEIKFIET